MSQAKLEFLAGKSVPAIIDWMLENMKETDIRGCLDAAGIQTSVGSRSAGAGSSTDPLPPPRRTPGAGSSTDPLPPPRRTPGAGSSTDPFPFSRAAAAGSSTDPLPPIRIPSAGLSRESLPFFAPGAATRLISREPSEEQIRPDFYQPPSLFMREPSEEMVDPYSTFIAPGLRQRLIGDNEFGRPINVLLNKLLKIQLEKQMQAREQRLIGNSINYIPLLIFDLEEKDGIQYLSFIVIEPIENDFRTSIVTIKAFKQGKSSNKELELLFETEINTLLNQWSNYTSNDNISDEIDSSFNNFVDGLNNSDVIINNIQMLYSKKNTSMVNLNNFGESDEHFGESDQYFGKEEDEPYNFYIENNNFEDIAEENFEDSAENKMEENNNFGKDNPDKPKKFGKISSMNKEELREYVINKFGQNYYNEYEPQVYKTKTGFGNVRYVKRSSPLSESGILIPGYDYSTEHEDENSEVNFFD
jgi:hypothetical protein